MPYGVWCYNYVEWFKLCALDFAFWSERYNLSIILKIIVLKEYFDIVLYYNFIWYNSHDDVTNGIRVNR